MKILTVGGSGYVGGCLTSYLEMFGHDVKVYDALVYEDCYLKPGNLVVGDIRDHEKLKKHLAWADVVYWLAALVGDPACANAPELARQLNQEEVSWLAGNYDGPLVFFSTCSVYGAQDALLDESAPTGPLSVYAQTKLAAEGILMARGGPLMIFRLGTLFGIGDMFSRIRLDLAVNYLTMQAHTQVKLSVFGGEQYRPFLHVRDAARMTAIAGTEWKATGIFNLKGENLTIMEFAKSILVYHYPDLLINVQDLPFEDLRNYRVSSARAEKVLGLYPEITVSEGVAQIKELLEQGRLANPQAHRFSNILHLKSNPRPELSSC